MLDMSRIERLAPAPKQERLPVSILQADDKRANPLRDNEEPQEVELKTDSSALNFRRPMTETVLPRPTKFRTEKLLPR
jgi:hypothetical protein